MGSKWRTAVAMRRASPTQRLAFWLGLAFTLQLAALDVYVRGPDAFKTQPRLIGGLVASWALLAFVVQRSCLKRAWPRALLAFSIGLLVASGLGYYRYYHGAIDAQVAVAARHAWADVRPMLLRSLPGLGLTTLVVAAIEFAWLGSLAPPPVNWPILAVALVGGFLMAGTPQRGTSEIRTAHAAWVLMRTREANPNDARESLPELQLTRTELPNVLIVITESVRARDACQNRGCATSPEFDRLLPDRVTLQQARALSSYTAIALSAIATGRTQLQSRRELARAPDLFDFARAVRASGAQYSVRYWSSQLAGVFERGPLSAVVDEVITAETLLGHPATDIEDSVAALLDRRIADYCERHLRAENGAQLLVVHLSGTHAPYAFDAERAPHRPWQRQVTWSGLSELHNAYLNALLEQDRSIARCLAAFGKSVEGRPWLVIYTSDHGESFGEHSAIHHGQNLYDEQIRVPLILAHGGHALSDSQAAALQANANAFTTHLDILPTLLDLWGISHHIAVKTRAVQLRGRSLLSPLGPMGVLPITNCTELFPCPINTWGLLGDGIKLTAQSWDGNWRCLTLSPEESERTLDQCAELVRAACQIYPRLPNGNVSRACPQ